MPKRNGGDGGNEDADNEQQQQQQQRQEVITTLSGVVDEDGKNHSRSPGMREKSQSNIEDEEDG